LVIKVLNITDARCNHEVVDIILMYVPCILYSLLSRPTNAQHIYIYNILYIVSTATCFDTSTSYPQRGNTNTW